MLDAFQLALSQFVGETVRIYIEGGEKSGFAGCILGVSRDFVEVLVLKKVKHQYVPGTIVIVPLNKITAVNFFAGSHPKLVQGIAEAAKEAHAGKQPQYIHIILIVVVIFLLVQPSFTAGEAC